MLPDKKKHFFTVTRKEGRVKLLSFLRDKLKEIFSVKAIKRSIDDGACLVNGAIERFSTALLNPGDKVEFNLDIPSRQVTSPLKISILHEDGDLLICNKPAGIVSLNENFQKQFSHIKAPLKLVHRLDKDTSGVIVLAKTELAKKDGASIP